MEQFAVWLGLFFFVCVLVPLLLTAATAVNMKRNNLEFRSALKDVIQLFVLYALAVMAVCLMMVFLYYTLAILTSGYR